MAWWLPDSWRTAPIGQLDRLLFFELKVTAAGEVSERHGWPDNWQELRAAAKQGKVPLDLTLTLFDPKAFEALFASDAATRRLLDELSQLASHEDVAGLQIDFEVYEPLKPVTLSSFNSFIRTLSERLHNLQPARTLSVFFPMGGASTLYDTDSLKSIDHVVIQGYDSHWTGSKHAGPVAPLSGNDALTWEKVLVKASELGAPRDRLLFSFPLYGYEWPVQGPKARSATAGEGMITSFAPIPEKLLPAIRTNVRDRVQQHGAYHDPVSGSAYYHFKASNGQYIEGWFEDWWTLQRKLAFVRREGLAGMAFFILGYDHHELLHYYLRSKHHAP
jgi:spore germination protein YaaH